MAFKIVRNDIVKMNTEAIVNTANPNPEVGAGCDLAVYTAAGYEELLAYRKEHIGAVPEGDVFLTPGFRLQAKYIIHAVSPVYTDGNSGEEEKLRSCYRKSLALAKERKIRSIAFPLISTGSFGYPKEEGLRIALDEIYEFLFDNEMEIYLVVFDPQSTKLGEKLYPDLKSYIDRHYVDDKVRQEYFCDDVRGRREPEREEKGTTFFSRRERMETVTFGSVGSAAASAKPLRETFKQPKRGFRNAAPAAEESYAASALEESYAEEAYAEKAFRSDDEEVLNELKRKLDERKSHLADSFSEYLLYLIKEHGMTNVEVYKRAIVDKKLFAKIKNDPSYHPQKLTCLCLCIGAKLNMDETRDLLARAGYALSPCDMRDVIFSYFIENRIYDMVELDIQLEEYGIPCIIV